MGTEKRDSLDELFEAFNKKVGAQFDDIIEKIGVINDALKGEEK
jgi:hypothetical protein